MEILWEILAQNDASNALKTPKNMFRTFFVNNLIKKIREQVGG